jgi:2,4-didehydro-3-deoxy-L-rhamnonate hydrolase
MRIANLAGRAVLLTGDGAVDIDKVSAGARGPDPQRIFDDWSEARPVLAALEGEPQPYKDSDLRTPVPRPGQIFAIGVNYRDHAAESGLDVSALDWPMTFTKFTSCLTGPYATVTLPKGWVDWEVELVVVVGQGGHRILADRAQEHIAGYTIGQDLSERIGQWSGPGPAAVLARQVPSRLRPGRPGRRHPRRARRLRRPGDRLRPQRPDHARRAHRRHDLRRS